MALGILVFVVWSGMTEFYMDSSNPGWVATMASTSLLLGAGWQLLNPRDLTNRLTFIAVFAGLLPVTGMVIGALSGTITAGEMRMDSQYFALVLPLVSGVVIAEHFLRWRIMRGRRRLRAEMA